MAAQAQIRVWRGRKVCEPDQDCQLASIAVIPTSAEMEAAAKRIPWAIFAPRAEEYGEVKDSPHEQETAHINVLADVALRVVGELCQEPGGKQQKSQRLLRFIAQQDPSCKRGDCPQKDGCGPVFLNIEDLAYERNGGAGGNRADRVQRGGEAAEGVTRQSSTYVEDGDHGHDDGVACGGAELVPVGRDEEHHAAGQQHGSENERHQALPAEAFGALSGGASLVDFVGANAARRFRIEDAGRLPAI